MRAATPSQGTAEHFVHIGRQPIYDRADEIVGYELLFRSDAAATGAAHSNTAASSKVIVSAFTEFGLAQLVGPRLGFVNLTRAFLVGEVALPFDAGQAVLEVLETIEVDAAVEAGVRELAEQGYPIALDDFAWGSGHERLLPLASYVKLQVAGVDPDHVAAAVAACRRYPELTLLAERLETEDDLRFARDVGFDLFQGYLLGRPQVVSAAALSPSRLRRMELVGYLSRPDARLDEVSAIVALDPALSYRMLRATSSAAVGRRRRVSSVHEAMVLLGTTRLIQWLSLMAISDLASFGENHLVPVLAQARLCQLLAERTGLDAASAFTTGVLAGVADLLSIPPDTLASQLPLTDDVAQALVDGTGGLGTVLAAVRAYEQADGAVLRAIARANGDLARDYLSALDWSMRTFEQVLGPEQAGNDGADPERQPGSPR